MDKKTLAKYIDHTALKADTTVEQIEKLCNEAVKYGFKSVCVNPCYVPYAATLLKGSGVLVCTVIGFPLGANTPNTKAFEALDSIANGADEVDMVVNLGAIKAGDWEAVKYDIDVVYYAAKGKALLKVIFETCLLTDAEKEKLCAICKEAGVDFVKTSTGFSTGGATVEDVKLMRSCVGPDMGVKASGGVKDYATAVAMIEAGATRLGTSSGVEIVK